MKFPINFKKVITVVKKYPWFKTVKSIKFLPQVFNRWEKIAILFFSVLIIASVGAIIVSQWLNQTQSVADNGGILREGIVGESKDMDKHIVRLVNAGLTRYDSQKNVTADMAQSWEIKEDGKVYVFHLKPNFNAEDLANSIINKDIWKDIEISTPDPQTITFTFKQSFSPFLYTSTEPIFEYGPYRISKESKNEVELSARDDYFGGRPYIDKILIKFYKNQDDLLKAARRGDIDSFALSQDTETIPGFQKQEMKLARDLMVFFNLSNKDLQDVNVRKALKENSSVGKPLKLRLVTSDNQKNVEIAQKIAEKWRKNGIEVNLEIKDNITLQKDIIPKRDYDVLIYGLDYGEDPDPYPFWHSSQIKEDGKNLSNFKNTPSDKLLEEARQELDFQKREEKYAEFQKILDSEIPAFAVEHENLYYQISQKVFGVQKIVGSFESDRFLNANSWYIDTKRVRK